MGNSLRKIFRSLSLGKKKHSEVDPTPTVSVDLDPGRIHPLLPTVDYARGHPEEVYSDHLPRGCEWKPLKNAPPIQFRSWNVMGGGVSGFDDKGEGDFFNLEDKQDRFDRISATIKKWQDDTNVAFIALQEAGNEERVMILKALGIPDTGSSGGNDEWGYEATGPSRAPVLSFYRKSVLRLETSLNDKDKANFHYKEVPIQIHSAYMGHSNFPDKHHEKVQAKLTDPKKPSIILGDFNCRFAPTPKSPPSLFTVVTAKFFRSSKKQGGDHVDAALVRDDKGISQLETWVINPKTGKKYEAPPPTTESVPSADKDLEAERKRYSPVMEESWMQGPLREARKHVKEEYNISVFMAFNNEKDPKIAFRFKDGFLYALYKASLSPEDKVICSDYPQGAKEKPMSRETNESCVFIDYTRLDLGKFQKFVASAYSRMEEIKGMFPQGTNFSIIPNPQSGVLSLAIKPPGNQDVFSIPVDKDIMGNLSSRTKTDASESAPRSHHI